MDAEMNFQAGDNDVGARVPGPNASAAVSASGRGAIGPIGVAPAASILLVTSRRRFTLPRMVVWELEALDHGRRGGGAAEHLPADGALAAKFARLCGRLPLALRVSAGVPANDETLGVEDYLAKLVDERQRLKALRYASGQIWTSGSRSA